MNDNLYILDILYHNGEKYYYDKYGNIMSQIITYDNNNNPKYEIKYMGCYINDKIYFLTDKTYDNIPNSLEEFCSLNKK